MIFASYRFLLSVAARSGLRFGTGRIVSCTTIEPVQWSSASKSSTWFAKHF